MKNLPPLPYHFDMAILKCEWLVFNVEPVSIHTGRGLRSFPGQTHHLPKLAISFIIVSTHKIKVLLRIATMKHRNQDENCNPIYVWVFYIMQCRYDWINLKTEVLLCDANIFPSNTNLQWWRYEASWWGRLVRYRQLLTNSLHTWAAEHQSLIYIAVTVQICAT